MTRNRKDKGSRQSIKEPYKLPLVWIKLETTGLNVEVDRILEIACMVTDGKLRELVEGPDLFIHQTKESLDKVGEWCQDQHAGMTKKVRQSAISEQEAEEQVIDFVKRHVIGYTPLLAGNSVYVDLMFLQKYMPRLACLFSHVLVDVSSIMALCCRWFPEDKKAPRKEKKPLAIDDIKDSIVELKHYKEHVFKSSKSKR
uniref:oligoribonuclease-like isoform X2 n=1 Tax=Erigeron canadensis TaxID=72917 RepID=UPI001CB8EAF0|nr:oligoribonuclease-like isoform X2 [Erigeron canadensis]